MHLTKESNRKKKESNRRRGKKQTKQPTTGMKAAVMSGRFVHARACKQCRRFVWLARRGKQAICLSRHDSLRTRRVCFVSVLREKETNRPGQAPQGVREARVNRQTDRRLRRIKEFNGQEAAARART